MNDFEERLFIEKEELSEKISKLYSFIESEIYSTLEDIDRNLLIQQIEVMNRYLDILNHRITRLKF